MITSWGFKMDDRPIGEWIDTGYEEEVSEIMYCSVCGYATLDYLTTEICPECQSIMTNYFKFD